MSLLTFICSRGEFKWQQFNFSHCPEEVVICHDILNKSCHEFYHPLFKWQKTKSCHYYRILIFFTLQNRCGYAAHMESDHDTYICPTCNKVFERYKGRSAKTQYKRHMETKCGKPKPPEKYACSGQSCDRRFTNKEKLYAHEGKCEYVIHKCDKCGEVFKNRRYIYRHKCTVIRVPRQQQQQQPPLAIPRNPPPHQP